MTSLNSQLPAYSLESVSDQRAVGGMMPMPAAPRIHANAWPQPQSQPLMDPFVFTSYDVDERPWPTAFAPFDSLTKGQQYQFGYEPHVNPVDDDEDDLSEELEEWPLSTSTVANSPISEFSTNHHHQQQISDYPGTNLEFATTTTTAALGSEEYPSPIFALWPGGDNGGCARLHKDYNNPLHLDHVDVALLPLALPGRPYLPDSSSPFLLAQDATESGESAAFWPEKESFSPATTTDAALMVASPSHIVQLHAPRPMRIENTAAHLAALVEREETKLEAQEPTEPLIDSVLAPRTRTADQLSPLTAPAHLVPYAQLYTQQYQVQPLQAFATPAVQPVPVQQATFTSELPRRRIQPILELDTSGRTMQLRQSMRSRRHARNMSVPMSADALQYRPVGWRGRQDVVGQHPHLLVQDQYAYGAWSASASSRSMDWSALGGDLVSPHTPH